MPDRAVAFSLGRIKAVTHLLPPDWASKAESALRIFGADRALLLVEGVALANSSCSLLPIPSAASDKPE
jgi:hypothetical protein